MKFPEYRPHYKMITQGVLGFSVDGVHSAEELLEWIITEGKDYPPLLAGQVAAESLWSKSGRPHYDVWPSMVECLSTIDLSEIPARSVTLPLPQLLIRLASGESEIETILASECETDRGPGWIVITDPGGPPVSQLQVAFHRGESISIAESIRQALSSPEWGLLTEQDRELSARAVQIVATICLIGSDPGIVEPLALARDRPRYEQTGDWSLIERARRRGCYGFAVGRQIESAPGFRRPHFGLRWTGPGRKVPRVVPIKGAVIHREKLARVPSGNLDDQWTCPMCGQVREEPRCLPCRDQSRRQAALQRDAIAILARASQSGVR